MSFNFGAPYEMCGKNQPRLDKSKLPQVKRTLTPSSRKSSVPTAKDARNAFSPDCNTQKNSAPNTGFKKIKERASKVKIPKALAAVLIVTIFLLIPEKYLGTRETKPPPNPAQKDQAPIQPPTAHTHPPGHHNSSTPLSFAHTQAEWRPGLVPPPPLYPPPT